MYELRQTYKSHWTHGLVQFVRCVQTVGLVRARYTKCTNCRINSCDMYVSVRLPGLPRFTRVSPTIGKLGTFGKKCTFPTYYTY